MGLTFANPLGAWALLGIPAILIIHLLQRHPREQIIAGLFLLDQKPAASARGRRFARLRNSAQLWFQLLAVMLLSWLLMRPMWLQEESVQPVAIVLDSSYSMRAFEGELHEEVSREMEKLEQSTALTEWYMYESEISRGILYHGSSLKQALLALRDWHPSSPGHDFRAALKLARLQVGKEGLVMFVTDHPVKVADLECTVLSVGSPRPNVGFTGGKVESGKGEWKWRAVIRNYGPQAVERTLVLHADEAQLQLGVCTLKAGEQRSFTGSLPPGLVNYTLRLDADDFALDDVLYFKQPVKKPLPLQIRASGEVRKFCQRLEKTISDQVNSSDTPELVLMVNYGNPLPPLSGIFFGSGDVQSKSEIGVLVQDRHPFMKGLNFQGLICMPFTKLPTQPEDIPLLWSDSEPVILLRKEQGLAQLICRFTWETSNADRNPAFIVLLHRFVESVRRGLPKPYVQNLEVGQQLSVQSGDLKTPLQLFHEEKGEVQSWPGSAPHITLPAEPGYYRLNQSGNMLWAGGVNYVDVQESDLSSCAPQEAPAWMVQEVRVRNSRADVLTPLWILLLGGMFFGSWFYAKGRQHGG